MRFDEKLLLAKLESNYGNSANPTGANAIVAKDLELTPIEAESVDRGLVKPHLGADEMLSFGEHVLLSFKVEAQGSGTLGLAPAVAPLLRCAGFAEVIVADTSVTYQLAATDQESATLHFYQGSTLHAMVGARANVKYLLEKGIPYFEFNIVGLYQDPTKVTVPAPDWSSWKKPTLTGKGRTHSFSMMGFAAEPYKLTLDVGQDVKYIQTLTTEKVELNDRAASGSVTIADAGLDSHNYFADVKNDKAGALTVTHGNADGLKLTVNCPKVQLKSPKYSEQEKSTALDFELTLIPTDAGNDEIEFVFT